jgi:hypothetical protein
VDDLTSFPVVSLVRDMIARTLGPQLLGLYVYGSSATGDFEPDVSDIDLIAVLTDEPNDLAAGALAEMHASIARAEPEWDDRVEVDYVSARGLTECRIRATTIARISPGEPLHLIEAGRDFLLDWYPARSVGMTLVGPPITSLIPPIPESEYLEEVRKYLAGFRTRFDADASAGSQAYAILTMCRGLYSIVAGEQLSKRDAALRARRDFPHREQLIDQALAWRARQWDAEQPDASGSVAEVRTFIDEIADRIGLS